MNFDLQKIANDAFLDELQKLAMPVLNKAVGIAQRVMPQADEKGAVMINRLRGVIRKNVTGATTAQDKIGLRFGSRTTAPTYTPPTSMSGMSYGGSYGS